MVGGILTPKCRRPSEQLNPSVSNPIWAGPLERSGHQRAQPTDSAGEPWYPHPWRESRSTDVFVHDEPEDRQIQKSHGGSNHFPPEGKGVVPLHLLEIAEPDIQHISSLALGE